MHLNFNHLKSFYYVAKHNSFTKAAGDLNVSQSTMSLQVMQLEKQFNFLLFRRGKKGIELTDEGKIAFSYAKKIFSIANQMEGTIKDLNALQAGNLRIGTTRLIARYVLPKIVQILKRKNPKLKLELYSGLSREILQKVIDFEYHVGIIGRVPYPGNIIFKKISQQPLCFIANDEVGDRISLKDLANYPIIILDRGSATREYLINEFAKSNISLNTYVESENPSAIKHMVQLGMGGAFLPEFGIEEEAAEGKFNKAEVTENLYLDYDVIYLMERKKSKAIQSFISAAKNFYF
jgi:DNA-binding transcriptional LysR family regulator